MNVDALRRDLESAIAGEVRFDAITRALYSTDASVYQIQPLGVVVVKSREDVVRTVTICDRHRCPLTMRGGGTSQAGQAIGSGTSAIFASTTTASVPSEPTASFAMLNGASPADAQAAISASRL